MYLHGSEGDMDVDQEKFLKDEFFSLTLMATVGRSGVYASGLSEKKRTKFRSALQSQLEQIAKRYEAKVSEDDHVQHIRGLSDRLSKDCADILQGGRFRIGTA